MSALTCGDAVQESAGTDIHVTKERTENQNNIPVPLILLYSRQEMSGVNT